MQFCRLCNGMGDVKYPCPVCGETLSDEGKIYDFYDDYSPYMEIDWNKLADGIPGSANQEECAHLFSCPHCGENELKIIEHN